MSLRTFLAKHPLAFKVWTFGADIISNIHWPRTQALLNGGVYWALTEEDHDKIRRLLKEHYCFILTRRKSQPIEGRNFSIDVAPICSPGR